MTLIHSMSLLSACHLMATLSFDLSLSLCESTSLSHSSNTHECAKCGVSSYHQNKCGTSLARPLDPYVSSVQACSDKKNHFEISLSLDSKAVGLKDFILSRLSCMAFEPLGKTTKIATGCNNVTKRI